MRRSLEPIVPRALRAHAEGLLALASGDVDRVRGAMSILAEHGYRARARRLEAAAGAPRS